jgi:hypothetical protein
MKKIIVRVGIVIVLLVVAAVVVVFLSLNSIVKKGVETVGPQVTKVSVTLGAADISPLSGSGRLSKFVVGNPEGYKTPSAIQFDDIKLGVSISSLMSDTIVVNEVNIQGAQVTLEGSNLENNLLKILNNVKGNNASTPAEPKSTNAAPAAQGSKSSKKFMVKDLVIEGTKANLEMDIVGLGHQSKSITIPTIHLQNIGTAENGVTVEQLTEDILKPLVTQIVQSAADAFAGKALNDLKNGDINAAKKSVTDLFKK